MNELVEQPGETMVIRAYEDKGELDTSVASASFRTQTILSGSICGEMTAMRAWFPAGVVTNWHSHPRGQLLFALAGEGKAQSDGEDVVTLHPGDAIWFPPGKRHWHGAGAGDAFSYISIQQIEDGSYVTWMEPVAGLAGPANA
ncbi:cupin domain-containing protein [Brucella anthropi]|uniref:cupin domain-containing protein n=1 Tax=Brucella anthropi TaxID=529 RepID=UPI003D98F753